LFPKIQVFQADVTNVYVLGSFRRKPIPHRHQFGSPRARRRASQMLFKYLAIQMDVIITWLIRWKPQ